VVRPSVSWDWSFALSIIPELLKGLVITVEAAVLGFILAMTAGLIIALLRESRSRPISLTTGAMVEFIRRTPLLVQLFVVFYLLPDYGLVLAPLQAGIVALGIHYSTYASEVYRAGILSVPRGQWEAALALNLSVRRTWLSVIIPQAIPAVVPALGNYMISMFKEVPLLSAITVIELLNVAKIVGAASFRYLEPITLVGILFVIISYSSSLLLRRLEHVLRRYILEG
jgi:polar amino acid transport system permease protein